jgi:hypothetical protein
MLAFEQRLKGLTPLAVAVPPVGVPLQFGTVQVKVTLPSPALFPPVKVIELKIELST